LLSNSSLPSIPLSIYTGKTTGKISRLGNQRQTL